MCAAIPAALVSAIYGLVGSGPCCKTIGVPADQADAQPLRQRPAAALKRQPQDAGGDRLWQITPVGYRFRRLRHLPL